MKKILIIDNNDSFVYNLFEYLQEMCSVEIVLSSQIDFRSLDSYDGIVLSPGAGVPSDYPMMMQLIKQCHTTHSLFGVCLGHQAICQFFGYQLHQIPFPKHGHTSILSILDANDPIFQTIPDGSNIGRYHSWTMLQSGDSMLNPTALDEEGNIMAVSHRELPIYGVQFHPESIITEHGKKMLQNWVNGI